MSLKLPGSDWSAPRSRASVRNPETNNRKSTRCATRGIVSVEIALLAIALLGGVHMLFLAGRLSEANGRTQDIASEAARLASQAQDGADAQKRVADFLKGGASQGGQASGSQASGQASRTSEACRKPQATVDISAFSRGGSVSVKVRCSIPLSDLALVRIPGSLTLEAEAAEVIDVLRSGS